MRLAFICKVSSIAKHKWVLAAACLQRRQCKFRRDFFALRPIVVGVALEAARFRVVGPRRMARPASSNSRQQEIARLRTRQRLPLPAPPPASLTPPLLDP